ncbi:MAG: histidine kinase dimerization/phosphoacceptor domain -containing protein [Flavobacteriales bacterium]
MKEKKSNKVKSPSTGKKQPTLEIEGQLRLSEEKHRMLFSKANDSIFIIKDNKVIDSNEKSLEMFGCTQKEIMGKPLYHFLPEKQPDGADSILKFYDLTLLALQGKSQFFYWKFLRFKGEQFDAEVSLNSFDVHGETMLQAIVRDITRRKEAEEFKNKSIKSYFELFNTSSDYIFIVNESEHIIDINHSAIVKYGLSKEEIIGKTLEIIGDESKNPYSAFQKKMKKAKDGNPQQFDWKGRNNKNEFFPLEINIRTGSYFGKSVFIITAHDISERMRAQEEKLRAEIAEATTSFLEKEIAERKASEAKLMETLSEREMLLKEVHHRVKNNLQVISSILNLQSSYVKDQYTLSMLKECRDRIKSMSFIHESLYQTKNFSHVDFGDYLKSLCSNLLYSYSVSGRVTLNYDIENIFLTLDTAIPTGLIVNELVSNSLKYAFPDNQKGNIFVSLKRTTGGLNVLKVEDDGVGMPANVNYKQTDSLGLQLVVTLSEQIDGELVLKKAKGTCFVIEFKAN